MNSSQMESTQSQRFLASCHQKCQHGGRTNLSAGHNTTTV